MSTFKIETIRRVEQADVDLWAEVSKLREGGFATADQTYPRPDSVGNVGELLFVDANAHKAFAKVKNVRKRSRDQKIEIATFLAVMGAQATARDLEKSFGAEFWTVDTLTTLVETKVAEAIENVDSDAWGAWLAENTQANRETASKLASTTVHGFDKVLKVDKEKSNRRHAEILTTDAKKRNVLLVVTITELDAKGNAES